MTLRLLQLEQPALDFVWPRRGTMRRFVATTALLCESLLLRGVAGSAVDEDPEAEPLSVLSMAFRRCGTCWAAVLCIGSRCVGARKRRRTAMH